jgi:hypothetical protein
MRNLAEKRRELVKLELDPAGLAAAGEVVKAWRAKDRPGGQRGAGVCGLCGRGGSPECLARHPHPGAHKLGYDVRAPDGQMGEKTSQAIKSFERRNGLEETGQVTIELVTKLERLTS